MKAYYFGLSVVKGSGKSSSGSPLEVTGGKAAVSSLQSSHFRCNFRTTTTTEMERRRWNGVLLRIEVIYTPRQQSVDLESKSNTILSMM